MGAVARVAPPGYIPPSTGSEAQTMPRPASSGRSPEVPFTALYLDRRLVSPKIRAFIDFVSDRKPASPDRN